MVQIVFGQNSEERDRFWKAYRACVEENRVSPDRSLFYVKWVQAFADFLPERLQDRSGKDIKGFLAELRQRQGIADWQVNQAEHALKILYEIFLPRYVPGKAPPHPVPKAAGSDHGQATGVKTGKTGGFLDRTLPGEVERRFSSLVEAIRSEIRTRHYSYRTESSYLDWVRRFIAFHEYADPRGLDEAVSVKGYLEYLAVEREVSAST